MCEPRRVGAVGVFPVEGGATKRTEDSSERGLGPGQGDRREGRDLPTLGGVFVDSRREDLRD